MTPSACGAAAVPTQQSDVDGSAGAREARKAPGAGSSRSRYQLAEPCQLHPCEEHFTSSRGGVEASFTAARRDAAHRPAPRCAGMRQLGRASLSPPALRHHACSSTAFAALAAYRGRQAPCAAAVGSRARARACRDSPSTRPAGGARRACVARANASNGSKPPALKAPYNVLITGSTKGIGLALARRHLVAGDNVVVCSRSDDAVRAVSKALRDEFGAERVVGRPCNVGKAGDVASLAAFAQVWSAVDTPRHAPRHAPLNTHARRTRWAAWTYGSTTRAPTRTTTAR